YRSPPANRSLRRRGGTGPHRRSRLPIRGLSPRPWRSTPPARSPIEKPPRADGTYASQLPPVLSAICRRQHDRGVTLYPNWSASNCLSSLNSPGEGRLLPPMVATRTNGVEGLFEGDRPFPHGLEGDAEGVGERRMLDHHHRRLRARRHRVVEGEHHQRPVHERHLQRELLDEACFLAGLDETPYPFHGGGVRQQPDLVDRPSPIALHAGQALDVLLHRESNRWLGEHEDLLSCLLRYVGGVLGDRGVAAQDLDEIEGFGVVPSRIEFGLQALDQLRAGALDLFHPAPVLVEEPSDGGGGRHGGVADDVSGTARGETPVDQAPHDVVDAGPGDARPPG